MKKYSISAARFVWRRSLAPLLRRLPGGWSARVQTLAHHTKMTLLHGHVIDFGHPASLQEYPVDEQGRVTVPPAEQTSVGESARSGARHHGVLPDYAIHELKELEQIEADLAPTREFVSRFHTYSAPMNLEPARVYAECSAVMAEIKPDLILLVPWLVRGGADLGALLHVNAAMSAGRRVLMIATIDAESPWKSRLPAGVGFIEFGKLSHNLSELHRQEVLVRLLLESSAGVIHNINSYLAWDVTKRFGRSLTGLGKRIYTSVFSDGRDENGVMWSYPRFFFVDCWRYLSGVICDSAWYPGDLVRQYGVPRTRLHTAYFPMTPEKEPQYRAQLGGRILWASRITFSKRPDLLIGIARAMPDVQFDVFGYTDASERHYESELAALPNITLRGKYESLEAAAAGGNYSAFLYTSAWDGLPNVLLEATAAGLPVIASAICGVPEFINEETGYPVFDIDNVDAYVSRLSEVLADESLREKKWCAARDLLRTRHNPDAFLQSLRTIPGYLD